MIPFSSGCGVGSTKAYFVNPGHELTVETAADPVVIDDADDSLCSLLCSDNRVVLVHCILGNHACTFTETG